MKNLVLTFVFLLSFFTASFTMAESFSKEKRDAIVDNLIAGINSENQGIRTSAAYILGDLVDQNYLTSDDASKGVIPLMSLIRKGGDEDKIVAALSLYKIGDGQGIYFLRGVAKFDDSSRVRNISKNLYCSFHKNHGSAYFCDF